MRWGLTASDKAGHTTEIRFRTKPVVRNMVGEIQSRLPEGYFKTQSHLYRAVFSIGCIVAIEHIKNHGDTTCEKLEAVFDVLNHIAWQEQIEDIKKEAKSIKMKAIDHENPELLQQSKKIDKMVESLEKLW